MISCRHTHLFLSPPRALRPLLLLRLRSAMDSSAISGDFSDDPYALLLRGIRLVPVSHYLVAGLGALLIFLYSFLEIHFLQDLLAGLRGSPAAFTHHPSSHIFNGVVSKCRILRSRYLATPWLSSPHVQTVFLNFFGRAPRFSYRRELFRASDGGTIALDWLTSFDVQDGGFHVSSEISRDDTTPIMLVVPGLTSDSHSPYLKHLAFTTAKSGWHVCVSNHRGLGGVSITSDRFYNAGWTGDLRVIANYLHTEYPKAPLFAVGTSIGANVMVKYLGEDGDNVPFAGAVAICSPWDLLIGDRFIRRRSAQKFYDRALTIGLQGYAQLHEPHYSRLANWEGILKSRTIRDFDDHATCLVGQFETVDTYYRHASSASYVPKVSIPLLCVSALDDPVCTREAIPWDECRANKNVVLATVKHGGHLAFFEGITASSLWWVRATCDFVSVLHSSKYMHVQSKIPTLVPQSPLDSTIDQAPFLSVTEDGTVAPVCNEQTKNVTLQEAIDPHGPNKEETENGTLIPNSDDTSTPPTSDSVHAFEQSSGDDVASPVRRCLDLLRRQNGYTIWLLAYIAVVTSWPLLGSAIRALYKKRLRNLLPAALLRR